MQKGLHAIHFHIDQLHFDVTYRQFVLRAAANGARVIPQFTGPVTAGVDVNAGHVDFGALKDFVVEQTETAVADGCRAAWTMVQPMELLPHPNDYPALCVVWDELTEELPLYVLCSFDVNAIGRERAQLELARHAGYYAGGWFCTECHLTTGPGQCSDRGLSHQSAIAAPKTSPEPRSC